MIHIICGTCGTSKGYKTRADGAISLPAAEEARLVKRGVAAYTTVPIIGNAPNAPTTPPSGGGDPEEGNQDTPGGNPASETATGGEEGNAEVKRLERMSKDDLLQMAQDMGVDISGAKNNHERAVLIVAAGASDDGDAPPDLGAGDIVQ